MKSASREGEGIMAPTHSPTESDNESQSRHTPGPWSIAPHPDDAEVLEIVADYHELGGRKIAHWIAECDAGIDNDDTFEAQLLRNAANARLIAAAPDLLAALKALRNEVIGAIGIGISDSIGHTNTRCLGDKCQDAYAAIAKAED